MGTESPKGAPGDAGPRQDPWVPEPPGWGASGAAIPGPPVAGEARLTTRAILGLLAGLTAVGALGLWALAALLFARGGAHAVHAEPADIAKTFIALFAAGWSLILALSAAMRRPAPQLLQKVIGVALGLAAIVAYFQAFQFGYSKYYHRWEHYHFFVGAKYFPELGYDGLYRCGVVAQDELGVVAYDDADGQPRKLDMRKEVRDPSKTIRNLGGDDLLTPVDEILEHPERCKDRFSPARWEKFKADVAFFRTQSDKGYWADMQRDHGYNMPPVWTIAGRLLAELHPASVGFQQLLSMIDVAYLLGAFAALWWAFGWRVSVAAMVLWGCQASAPFYWTGGAYLKQDWLFYLVLGACLLRKRRYRLAGAAMAYASLLRVFPVYVAGGWLVLGAVHFFQRRRVARSHRRVLLGAAIATAVLVPLSMAVAGAGAYGKFYERARIVEQAPLTNHMGLRVILAHDIGGGPGSGRMEFAKDPALLDPFAVWKRMRLERYERYAPAGAAISLLALAAFVAVARRTRLPWIAGCLGQIFIVVLAQLTCFHYTFVVLAAPLTRAKRWLEIYLFCFAALTQIVCFHFYWNDDKYTALSVVTLLFCFGLLAAFARRGAMRALRRRPRRASAGAPTSAA